MSDAPLPLRAYRLFDLIAFAPSPPEARDLFSELVNHLGFDCLVSFGLDRVDAMTRDPGTQGLDLDEWLHRLNDADHICFSWDEFPTADVGWDAPDWYDGIHDSETQLDPEHMIDLSVTMTIHGACRLFEACLGPHAWHRETAWGDGS